MKKMLTLISCLAMMSTFSVNTFAVAVEETTPVYETAYETTIPDDYYYYETTTAYEMNEDGSYKYTDNISWCFIEEDGLLYLFGEGDMKDNHWYLGKPEHPWDSIKEDIKTVEIEYGITSIDGYAFSGCTSLEEVIFPETLERIDGFAFSDCTSLRTVNLPYSIKSISEGAFSACSSLEFVNYPGTREEWNNLLQSPAYGIDYHGNDCLINATINYLEYIENPDYTTVETTYDQHHDCTTTETTYDPHHDCTTPETTTYATYPETCNGDCTTSVTTTHYCYDCTTTDYNYEYSQCVTSPAYIPSDDVTVQTTETTKSIGGCGDCTTTTGTICFTGNCTTSNEIATEITYDEENYPFPEPTLYGDPTGNDIIDVRDVTAMNQYIIKSIEFTQQSLANADVVKDGIVDVADLGQMKKYIIKLIDKF